VIISIIAAIVLVAVALFLARVALGKERQVQQRASEELRELLLSKEEGKIEQEEFLKKQAELHHIFVQAPNTDLQRTLIWAVPVMMISCVIGVYGFLNRPREIAQLSVDMTASRIPMSTQAKMNQVPAMSVATPPKTNSGGDLNTMVVRLASKMEKDAKNGEGWLLLARTYGELRKPAEAANAYAKAAELLPPDAAMMADWVDARVMANDKKWDSKSKDILNQTIKLDAKNLKALSLAASEAYDRKDYPAAMDFWKRIKVIALPTSNEFTLADMNMKEAQLQMSKK
jgi:cytochrome c-type biogenesis protein CcmH